MSSTKNKFGMIRELTNSNIKWKHITVFPNKIVFNLRPERTVRIIQVNEMGITIPGLRIGM